MFEDDFWHFNYLAVNYTVLLGYIVDLLPTRFFLLSESSSKPKSKYEEEEPLGSIMLEAMGQAMKKGYQVIYL